jgi:hypothetical protein
MFCSYEKGNINFDQFEEDPLLNYNIANKQQLDNLLERFSASFNREKSRNL